jgi:hypothetical protein
MTPYVNYIYSQPDMALQVSHIILAWVISGRGWLGVSVLLGVTVAHWGLVHPIPPSQKGYAAVCVAPSPVLPKAARV